LQCHSGPVTRLRITQDDSLLFSTGDDGSLFILEVKIKEIKPRKVSEGTLYSDLDIILVQRQDIEEKDAHLKLYVICNYMLSHFF
jgi:hypothetical protein